MQVVRGNLIVLFLISIIASCTPPEDRSLKFKLPAQLLLSKQSNSKEDSETRIIPDFCNYNLEGLTCVLVPSSGSEDIVAIPDPSLECSFRLPKSSTYQIFLRQNGVLCAEILRSDSYTPTLVGKSELEFDMGRLVTLPDGSIHTENDPDYSSDTDGDFIADALDEDMDGNGILDVNEDCDQDGLPDSLDADIDGDASLNRDDSETVCVTTL